MLQTLCYLLVFALSLEFCLELSFKRIPLNFKQGLDKSTSSLCRIKDKGVGFKNSRPNFFNPFNAQNTVRNVNEKMLDLH